MRTDGMNVLIEGRKQTLDYVRTPHRFELVLSDSSVIGQRRAAQRMMGEALSRLSASGLADDASAEQVGKALRAALTEMAPSAAKAAAEAAPAAEAAAHRARSCWTPDATPSFHAWGAAPVARPPRAPPPGGHRLRRCSC